MVREASLRQKKFEAKVDAEVLARQTKALKPLMVSGQAQYFPNIASVESKVKTLVEAQAVTSLQVRDYLNFAREMYMLSKRFTATTLKAEAQVRVDKWVSRGLDGTLLVKTAQLFGVTPTALPTPTLGTYEFGEGLYMQPFGVIGLLTRNWGFADYLVADSFPVFKQAQFDRIAMRLSIAGGSGAKARLGVYNSNGKGYPKDLLLESEELNCEVLDIVEQEIDLTLDPAQYFLAFLFNSAVPQPSISFSDEGLSIGYDMMSDIPVKGWAGSWAFGNLPNPFPSKAEGMDIADAFFWIALRVKPL